MLITAELKSTRIENPKRKDFQLIGELTDCIFYDDAEGGFVYSRLSRGYLEISEKFLENGTYILTGVNSKYYEGLPAILLKPSSYHPDKPIIDEQDLVGRVGCTSQCDISRHIIELLEDPDKVVQMIDCLPKTMSTSSIIALLENLEKSKRRIDYNIYSEDVRDGNSIRLKPEYMAAFLL